MLLIINVLVRNVTNRIVNHDRFFNSYISRTLNSGRESLYLSVTISINNSEDGTIRGYDDEAKKMKVFIIIALVGGLIVGIAFNNVLVAVFSSSPQLNTISIPNNISAGKITNVRLLTFSNGVAVGNVNISLDGAASGNATTDPDGTLVLPVNATKNGSINIIAAKTGYRDGTSFVMSIAGLDVGASHSSITSGVSTFVTISVASMSKPIAGAALNITGAGVDFEGLTDANGQIVLQLNPPSTGKITILAKKSGYVDGITTISSAGQQSLSVSSGQSTLTVSVPVYVTYTVTAAGSAVNEAVVTLSGTATGQGITNQEGKTVILTTPYTTGTITVSANKTGFASGSTTASVVSTQSLNVVAAPSTIIAKSPSYVMFTVTSGNSFISEAIVTLTGAASGNGITNQNGQTIIQVTSTGPGTITASAGKTGYTTGSTTFTAAGLQTLSVSASPSNITNGVPTYVTFTVTSGGSAVSGASVSVSGGGITADGMTNSAGQVTLQLTASGPGTINVAARKAGYSDGLMTLTH